MPDSAAVDLAVTHAKSDPRTARFAGLVNGVLRGMARDKDDALPAELAKGDDAPDWFRDRLAAAYGAEQAAGDPRRASGRGAGRLHREVRSGSAGPNAFGGIVLPTGSVRVERLAGPVAELPGFAEGAWWVQDAAASLPARLLGDVAGQRVADLCAAPGGKTAQLALAGADVTAVDIVGEPAEAARRKPRPAAARGDDRRGRRAEIRAGRTVRRGAARRALLLDRHGAPPSRHALDEIAGGHRQARRPAGAPAARRASRMVKPGGRIVFSNCSLDPAEGELLVAEFLAETSRHRARSGAARARFPAPIRSYAATARSAPRRPISTSAAPRFPGSTASSPRGFCARALKRCRSAARIFQHSR